jgi:hypothetical protein
MACVRQKTSSAPTGLAEPMTAWPKQDLRICFENNKTESGDLAFPESEMKLIRETVNEQYTPARTGVHFVGWDECNDLLDRQRIIPDVVLLRMRPDELVSTAQGLTYSASLARKNIEGALQKAVDNSLVGSGTLVENPKNAEDFKVVKLPTGRRIIYRVLLSYSGACRLDWVKVPPEECTKGYVLHELGHVAGLRHEHARKESNSDPNCYGRQAIKVLASREPQGSSASTYSSDYDSESIMNYCHLFKSLAEGFPGGGAKLSNGDVTILQKMYLK